MNQLAPAKNTSPPANGADEPPPHPGFEEPATSGSTMPPPAKLFDRGERSQATQIEQARVIAEVQGAIVVAQNRPRDMDRALEEMRTVCRIEMMADRAFFSYKKGSTTINRGTVHLARELARIWGNITYGIKELSRHDVRPGEQYGESEMLAYAWDLQTNARPETTFIVPHYIDLSGGGKKPLKDARSIYENNANMGARRLREQILAVIPRWFTDEAEDICRQTLEHGDGKPFKERLGVALAHLKSIDVSQAMVEKKFGFAATQLTSTHLAELKILYRSLKAGEITRDEAFPETPAADVTKALTEKAARQSGSDGGAPAATSTAEAPAQAQSAPAAPAQQAGDDHAANAKFIIGKLVKATGAAMVEAVVKDYAEEIDLMRTGDEARYKEVSDAIAGKRAAFKR